MRYSRFKKQMDGTATKTRSRSNPNSPRKNNSNSKISKSPRKGKGKAKEETDVEDEGGDSQSGLGIEMGIKPEPGSGMNLGSRQGTAESEAFPGRSEKRFKLEPGLRGENQQQQQPTPKTMPGTPSSGRYNLEREASASPSEHEGFPEIDEMGFSFGENTLPGMSMPMYAPPPAPFAGGAFDMGNGSGSGFGMGSGSVFGGGMGHDNMYDPLWHGHTGSGGGNGMQSVGEAGGAGVQVKTEPRWEDAYRRV